MLEEQIVIAINSEMEWLAADRSSELSVDTANCFRVSGLIDLDALTMTIAGSVASWP